MNQIADILKLAFEAQQQKMDAVLATVVRTEGSAYRRAGAMMLICADGRSVGMISGGCLEPHIIKRAFWLTRNGANVQIYQTGNEQIETDAASEYVTEKHLQHGSYDDDLDSELNFGLGCNGRVHVLFERLATAMPLLEVIRRVRQTQQPTNIATLIGFDGGDNEDSGLQIGMRLHLEPDLQSGQIMPIDAHNHLQQVACHTCSTLNDTVKQLSQHPLDNKNTQYVVVKNDDGTTVWLLQRLQPQIRLLISGAGNDVMPLVTMAKLQDWYVTVIDSRPQYATRMRFPQADTVQQLPLADAETLLKLSNNAAVALMSHSLSQDRARLAVLLKHPDSYTYIGQLGPRYRTESLIQEISATHADPTVFVNGINKLHYPIGCKLGGDGPEALALGIMAQINAVMHGQTSPAECSATDLSNADLSNTASISSATAMSLV